MCHAGKGAMLILKSIEFFHRKWGFLFVVQHLVSTFFKKLIEVKNAVIIRTLLLELFAVINISCI